MDLLPDPLNDRQVPMLHPPPQLPLSSEIMFPLPNLKSKTIFFVIFFSK